MPVIPATARPLRQTAAATIEAERESAPTGTAPRGHKSVLAHAHELADDATALAASFGQRRLARNDGSTSGTAEDWAGRLLDESAKEHLGQLKNALLSHRLDALGLQQALSRLFSDLSDAYAALRALLADDELESQRELLEQALATLSGTSAAVMKAGANVAHAARATAARHRGATRRLTGAALRASYQALLGSEDALQLYVAWLDVFGEEERRVVIDFLTEALVADMCCADPSCSSPIFGRMLRSARLLSCLRTLERRFCDDAWLNHLIGEDGVVRQLRPMLRAFCDEEDARKWCESLLDQFTKAHPASEGLELCMALRRFIKSINSPEVLYPECRATVLDSLDQRNRQLLAIVQPHTLMLEI
jgi:type III secretion system YopN/LcrE/InvE/MxiC family regulator